MAETQKSEAQSEERTDTGIYAGVEKYTKEDHPKDNIAYDPATGENTGAGVPPSTAELSHRSETNGKDTISHEPRGSHEDKAKNASVQGPDEVTRRAVVPAPAPSREHLIENYPHIFPELEKQAANEAKQKEEAEKEAAKSSSDSSLSSSDEDATSATKSHDKKHKKHHKSHEKHKDKEATAVGADGHHHRGPVKAIVHALHLDRHDRKVEKEEKEEEEAEMKERKKRIAARNEMFKHGVNELTQTEATSRTEEEGKPIPKKSTSDGGAVSDARATNESIPLEILNPEGLERKEKEDEILKTGGDFEQLAWKKEEEVKVPADRIDNLIQLEHARKEAGLPAEDFEKDVKVAFHTADSFDRLDKVQQ